jgi:hypothetical protein
MPVSLQVVNQPGELNLEAVPKSARSLLRSIADKPTSDRSLILVQYLASFVHPDYVCNLSMLDYLSPEDKIDVMDFFQHFLSSGMSIEEQGSILRYIHPYLSGLLGGPKPH